MLDFYNQYSYYYSPESGVLNNINPFIHNIVSQLFNPVNDGVEVNLFQARPKPLITYGQPTLEGEFPWHAALYHAKGIDLAYICGASLISKSHVISVAHCVTKRRTNTPLHPDNLVVYLGTSTYD